MSMWSFEDSPALQRWDCAIQNSPESRQGRQNLSSTTFPGSKKTSPATTPLSAVLEVRTDPFRLVSLLEIGETLQEISIPGKKVPPIHMNRSATHMFPGETISTVRSIPLFRGPTGTNHSAMYANHSTIDANCAPIDINRSTTETNRPPTAMNPRATPRNRPATDIDRPPTNVNRSGQHILRSAKQMCRSTIRVHRQNTRANQPAKDINAVARRAIQKTIA